MEFSCSFAYSFKNINLGIVFLKIQHDNLHFHWSGMVISFNMTFQCAYFKSMILLFDFFSLGESHCYIVQTGVEFVIFLPLLPNCQDMLHLPRQALSSDPCECPILFSVVFFHGYSSDWRQFHSYVYVVIKTIQNTRAGTSDNQGFSPLCTHLLIPCSMNSSSWPLQTFHSISSNQNACQTIIQFPFPAVVWKLMAVSQIVELLTFLSSSDHLSLSVIQCYETDFFHVFQVFFLCFFLGGGRICCFI